MCLKNEFSDHPQKCLKIISKICGISKRIALPLLCMNDAGKAYLREIVSGVGKIDSMKGSELTLGFGSILSSHR